MGKNHSSRDPISDRDWFPVGFLSLFQFPLSEDFSGWGSLFSRKTTTGFQAKKKKWKMKKKNATYAFHVPFFQQFYIIVEWTLFKLSCIGQVSYINGHQHFGVLCGHDSVLIWLLVLVSTGIYLSTRNKQHYNIPISDKQPSQTTKKTMPAFLRINPFSTAFGLSSVKGLLDKRSGNYISHSCMSFFCLYKLFVFWKLIVVKMPNLLLR